MNGTGLFDPDNERLRRSLAWHSQVTTKLQARLLEAQKYVREHTGDPKLLAILEGNERVKAAFKEVDTASAFRLIEP